MHIYLFIYVVFMANSFLHKNPKCLTVLHWHNYMWPFVLETSNMFTNVAQKKKKSIEFI